MHATPLHLVVFVVAAQLADAACAQCSLQPSSGLPLPQLTGFAGCSTSWDPDGAGPAAPVLVVGGSSLVAGNVSDVTVATWDGSHWQPLGAPGPVTSYCESLVIWNGQLVAGGLNNSGSGTVSTWNGSAWTPIGAPLADGVSDLVVWNGDLVAVTHGVGSAFTIRRWNGATWTALPAPPSVQVVHSVVSYQGLLCVAGSDTSQAIGLLDRWNGASWLPSITATGAILCLAVRPSIVFGGSDTLYAAGYFQNIGGTAAQFIAATAGGSSFAWAALGTGLPTICLSMAVRNNGTLPGEVVASTYVQGPSSPVYRFASVGFGSASWSAMGDADMTSFCFHAGSFHGTVGNGNASCVRWNGSSQWIDVATPGLDGEIRAVTRSGDDMIVGGTFTTDGSTSLNGIARWNGASLQPLGFGLGGGAGADALLTLANGDVLAGGQFTTAGGLFAPNLARWNGTSWSSLGLVNGQVLALAQLPNGHVIAAGNFTTAGGVACNRIARWDGVSWSPLGPGLAAAVHALVIRGDGVLFAGGAFPGRIAQWNGTAWSPLGTGCNGDVYALAVRPNDDVVAVGAFTTAGGLTVGRCARWSASGWASMGAVGQDPAPPRAVLALPNGDIVAGRAFHQAFFVPDGGISRWNGTTWAGVGVDFDEAGFSASVSIRALALRANGELVAGGSFATVGSSVAFRLANLSSTCAAVATNYGVGCSSAAGPLAIQADTLPWIGSTFRTTTTGVAPGSLCLGSIGFAQFSVPLSALLPEGQPGCSLLNGVDVTLLLANGPGDTATSALALANDPALIGAPFFQQTVPLEFDLSGALVAVRASNALSLVIGAL